MADFMTSLWSSIFTPGPTPPLLLATNATFGALQLLLLALLVATYSIHFVVLSVLCAGLWAAINWFAAELIRAQEEEKKKAADGKSGTAPETKVRDEKSSDDEDEARGREQTPQLKERAAQTGGLQERAAVGSGVGLGTQAEGAETRQRTARSMDASGEFSTDSEWEKVSDADEEK